jgi:small-conductance mechanosensitive channel
MSHTIRSLERLVLYLITTLILTVAALFIFNQFIEPSTLSFSKILGQAVGIIIILAFSAAAIGIIRRFKPFIAQRLGSQASTIVHYVLFLIVASLMAFGILDILGVPSTDLLTGLGIISITIGLIISTFVGSLLSGFLVFTNYHFKVGDDVMFNNIPGKIIVMTALVTRIQTDVGQVTIPNSAVASGGVIITLVQKYPALKEGRLHYTIGDRVITPYMNEQGTIKEITALNTIIQLDSRKEITLLNNSILSGALPIAKITSPPSENKEQTTET